MESELCTHLSPAGILLTVRKKTETIARRMQVILNPAGRAHTTEQYAKVIPAESVTYIKILLIVKI